jgi:hypothetical protein
MLYCGNENVDIKFTKIKVNYQHVRKNRESLKTHDNQQLSTDCTPTLTNHRLGIVLQYKTLLVSNRLILMFLLNFSFL